MKSYKMKTLIGATLACFALSGCGDFLNIEPKTFVSEDNFWNEKTDIDQMVTGVYTKMQADAYVRRCIMWGEARSDNFGEGNNCSDQADIYRTLREYLLSTNQFTNWEPFYAVINQCNIVIARAPEVSEKDPVYTQSDVLATQAEMSCLRALSYFYLVRAFKDVPFYFDPIQSDDDARPIGVTSGDEIVRALIADLESVVGNALKAYPKDSDSKYNSNCNRVTQSAIYALLADLCLWDNQYQKCIDYAQKVIDAKYDEYEEKYSNATSFSNGNPALFKWANDTWSNGYPLYPCFAGTYYGNDFTEIFGSMGNSFESILELAYTNYDGSDNNYLSNTACADLYGNYYSEKGNAGQGFLAVYESVTADLTNSEQRVFSNKYDGRYYANLNTGSSSGSVTTAYPAKFVQTLRYITQTSGNNSTLPFYVDMTGTSQYASRNWIFYRLTDVMLMQAEALIESAKYDYYQNTDEDGERVYEENLIKAFSLIWTVNRRSILTNSIASNTVVNTYQLNWNQNQTRAALRSLCLAERRRELMFEGKRWFDLLRYCHREGNADYIKNTVPAKSGGSTPVAYEALFWPYNKNEVKNNSLLNQKPYYGDDTDGNFSSTK